eukprot:333845-Prorocentrum_lima.AAC.1
MTSSLVGSEMCIRDSSSETYQAKVAAVQHLEEIQYEVQLEQALEASMAEDNLALQPAPLNPSQSPVQLLGT